jgi:PilZ domain-containing protein
VVLDISLAGAGVETDEPLVPGERFSVAFATPTLWDPLVLSAIVAWSHPPRLKAETDALGRRRSSARAGLAFDYTTPDTVLSMFEMLAALGFE